MKVFTRNWPAIISCVEKGYADVLKEAYEKIPLARRATIADLRRTALHLAVYSCETVVVERMLKSVDPEDLLIQDENGQTALHLAILERKPELSICMLEISPGLGNTKNKDGDTPLILAAYNDWEDLCIHMIEHSCVESSLIFVQNLNEDTAFHFAASKGMRKLCKLLIERASANDLLLQDSNGSTTLHLALYNGNFEMAHQMLRVNPSLFNVRNRKLEKPIDILARKASSLISSRAQLRNIDRLIYSCIPDADLRRAWYDEVDSCKEESKMFERLKKIRNKKHQYLLICDLVYKLASLEESPLVIVAELGMTEVVKKIMNENPQSIYQRRSSDHKNAVLVAVENRRADVFELLLDHCRKKNIHSDVFGHKDDIGNNALHLVAKVDPKRRPWCMPGNTMQMHWEIKWYKYVRDSIPNNLWKAVNNEGCTPAELFKKEHGHLYKNNGNGEWLNITCQACSVVAGLIATVAFNSAATIPGSNNEKGYPNFSGHPALSTFVISAFIALCFSLVSLILFLSVLISPFDDLKDDLGDDISKTLPKELVGGLTTLFLSIVAMLVSFCAGHYFYLKHTVRFVAIPVYLIGCLIIAYFFFKKVYSIFLFHAVTRKPEPWYEISK